ncbi:MAG: DUF5668 domain-containing protein [Terriglobales bacterium]
MASAAPAAGFVAGAGFPPPPPPGVPAGYIPPPVPPPMAPMAGSSGPNPTVAGILAGFFPFGVGAVYTGQYAKGLAHLAIFGLLIAGISSADHGGGEAIGAICGIALTFFWIYQIVDAVRSARAIQAGLPAPDPYGLGATFGGGTRVDASKVPVGAFVLILLGAVFLLHTAGLFEHGFDRFWPVLLIGLGAWLFARNYGLVGNAGDPRTCRRRLMGPAVLFTIGTLFLLENLEVAGFHRTWPVILLVVGAVKLFERSGLDPYAAANPACGGVIDSQPPPPTAPPGPPPPTAPAASSEVNNG